MVSIYTIPLFAYVVYTICILHFLSSIRGHDRVFRSEVWFQPIVSEEPTSLLQPNDTQLQIKQHINQAEYSNMHLVSGSKKVITKRNPFLSLHKRFFTNRTHYYIRPLITDIFAIPQDKSMAIYAVFSALNLRPKNASVWYNQFTLTYNNKTVLDQIHPKKRVEALRVLKFIYPSVINEPVFYVDIYDKVRKNLYEHLYVEVLSTEKRGSIATCAMVSDYNTLGELKSWIAWYRLQQFSNVILYSVKPVPAAEKILERASPFVRYYQYQYPLNRYRQMREQRSIQLAVINSCFYRHRHQYDGIVFIDLDEFLFSSTNPLNVTKLLKEILQERKGDHFQIYSTMYYIPGHLNRTKSFEEGTIFSDYVLKEPPRFSKRNKYMLRSTSESSLSTHLCVGCSWATALRENQLIIHHFKIPHRNKTVLTFDDSMKKYTPLLQKEIQSVFG